MLATGADVDGRGVLGVECEHREVEVQRVGQALPAAAAIGALVEAARLRAPDGGVGNRGVCGRDRERRHVGAGKAGRVPVTATVGAGEDAETGCAGIRRRSAERDNVHSLRVGAEVRPGPGAPASVLRRTPYAAATTRMLRVSLGSSGDPLDKLGAGCERPPVGARIGALEEAELARARVDRPLALRVDGQREDRRQAESLVRRVPACAAVTLLSTPRTAIGGVDDRAELAGRVRGRTTMGIAA